MLYIFYAIFYIFLELFEIYLKQQLTGFEVLKQPGVMMFSSACVEVQVLRRAAGEGVNVDATGNSEVCW